MGERGAMRGGAAEIGLIKSRLSFVALLERDAVELRRAGAHLVACCPFHDEKSPSFTVHAPEFDHGHCYGCGWHGDIGDYYQASRSVTAGEAWKALAEIAGVRAGVSFAPARRPSLTPVTQPVEERKKPPLPRLRPLSDGEYDQLASRRGLSVAGLAAAAERGRLLACDAWPQFLDQREVWRPGRNAAPCWVITDPERRVAQFRRFDGGAFVRADGREIKAWTAGGPAWPVGARDALRGERLMLVEGGADMLAGYHFLEGFGLLGRVGVVAVLGASVRLAEDAVRMFSRRRVRIFMDADDPKGPKGIRPGTEAAARWSEQLTAAGAAVETFSLAGLMQKDGRPVKDLNDLANVDEAAWLDGELREAFFAWDF